jgi:transglutaminase-like putative cysteine protease
VTVRLALRICTYLLVIDGLAVLALAGFIEPPWWPFLGLMLAGSWFQEALRARVPWLLPRAHLLALLAAGFFLLDFVYLAESVLDGFVHLLLFALFFKLYTRRTLRDTRDVLLLAFFMLVAASALTVSVGYLFILVVFLLVGTAAFLLHHVVHEAERHAADRGAALVESRVMAGPSLLGLAAVAALVSLAFTFAFFFVIPRVGQATLPLRARIGQMMAGFSERAELGVFGVIQTDVTVAMRVHFPEGPAVPEALDGLRWRGVAFDHWNGREWIVSQHDRRLVPRGPGGIVALAHSRGSGPVVTQEVFLEPIGTEVLFAAPRLLGVVLSAGPLWVDALEAVTAPVARARSHYRAVSELESLAGRGGAGARELVPAERWRYLQLPSLSPRIPALARELARGSRDPLVAALRLEDHLRTAYRYSLDLRRSPGTDPLEDFLFVSRSGNCEFFATSLAVMLRTLGIPTRLVNGFQRGEWNPYGRYFLVRQRDAHSWVEAHIAGRGWVTLDPSPRAEVDAAWGSSAAFQYLDALRMRWHRYIVNWSLGDQLRASWAVQQRAREWRRSLFVGVGFPGGRRGAGIAAATALGLALLVQLWRRGLPAPGARLRRTVALPAYERMLKRLGRLGLAPGPGETAREFAGRVAERLPHARAPVGELTLAYEGARFGGRAVGPEEAERLWRLAEELGAATERSAGG